MYHNKCNTTDPLANTIFWMLSRRHNRWFPTGHTTLNQRHWCWLTSQQRRPLVFYGILFTRFFFPKGSHRIGCTYFDKLSFIYKLMLTFPSCLFQKNLQSASRNTVWKQVSDHATSTQCGQNGWPASYALGQRCTASSTFPVNTKHLYSIYTMSGQRRRRGADVV